MRSSSVAAVAELLAAIPLEAVVEVVRGAQSSSKWIRQLIRGLLPWQSQLVMGVLLVAKGDPPRLTESYLSSKQKVVLVQPMISVQITYSPMGSP